MEADGAALAADAPRDRPEPLGPAVLVAGAAAAGLVLRVLAARRKVLWFDEFLSANLIRHRWRDLLPAIRVEAHPPLYFVMLKAWCAIFGDGPAGLKSLSIAAGAAAAALLGDAVRRVRGEAAGIAATILVAFSAVQIDQSSEAKPYAVLAFFLAALLLAAVRDDERRTAGSLLLVLLAGAAAASTHFYGSVAAGAIGLAGVIGGRGASRRRGAVLLAAVVAVSAIWLVPAFSIPAGAADYIRDMWAGVPPWAPLVVCSRVAFPGWRPPLGLHGRLLPGVSFREIAAAAVIAAIAAGAFFLARRAPALRADPRARFLFAAAVLLWPGFLILESGLAALDRPVAIIGRSEVVAELGFAILVALAVARWGRRLAAYPVAALALVAFWTSIPQWRGRGNGPAPIRWEEALVRKWQATIPPGTRVDVVALGLSRPPFEYYASGDPRLRFISFPESQNDHPGWASHSVDRTEAVRLAAESRRLAVEIDAELDRGVPVYLADREGVRNGYLIAILKRDHELVRIPGGPGWLYRVLRSPELRA